MEYSYTNWLHSGTETLNTLKENLQNARVITQTLLKQPRLAHWLRARHVTWSPGKFPTNSNFYFFIYKNEQNYKLFSSHNLEIN